MIGSFSDISTPSFHIQYNILRAKKQVFLFRNSKKSSVKAGAAKSGVKKPDTKASSKQVSSKSVTKSTSVKKNNNKVTTTTKKNTVVVTQEESVQDTMTGNPYAMPEDQ